MSKPRIAIIIGTTRAARFADKPAQWIHAIAKQRADIDVDLVDLRDYPMPFFDEVASNAWAPSKDPVAQRWQKKVAQYDGYIFVTAEYNHSFSAALKNALDYAYPEWNRKPAAYVGYGGVGAARAVEQLRLVNVELRMAPLRDAVHIGGADFMGAWQQGKSLEEMTHLRAGADAMLGELAWWARSLKQARASKLEVEEAVPA
jgi:NAD(P)H-dependent FMN reductase